MESRKQAHTLTQYELERRLLRKTKERITRWLFQLHITQLFGQMGDTESHG